MLLRGKGWVARIHKVFLFSQSFSACIVSLHIVQTNYLRRPGCHHIRHKLLFNNIFLYLFCFVSYFSLLLYDCSLPFVIVLTRMLMCIMFMFSLLILSRPGYSIWHSDRNHRENSSLSNATQTVQNPIKTSNLFFPVNLEVRPGVEALCNS